MGTMLSAFCKDCGFEKEFNYGAGIKDFKTVCNVPALNKKTGQFVIKNLFYQDKLKDEIVYYNRPEMFKGRLNKLEAHQWGDVYLKRNKNLCPKCKKYSLEFLSCGFFD